MEQQNRQGFPVTQESYGKRMWQLWGPIVIKWAIGFCVTALAMGIVSFQYMSSHYEMAVKALSDESLMTTLYEKIFTVYMEHSTLVEGAAALATIPVMLYWFHRDRVKEQISGIKANKKAPLIMYAAQLLMAFTLSMGINNLLLIGNIASVSESYQATMEGFYSAPLALQILCLGILIPVSEELVFRGLLFKRLRMRGTFMQAALYSALVFGFLHVNLVQMIYGFVLGMMLAYIYEKYGSVKAPVTAHIVMNLLSVLATEYNLYSWMAKDTMRIAVITIACAAVAATMFTLIQRIDEKPAAS